MRFRHPARLRRTAAPPPSPAPARQDLVTRPTSRRIDPSPIARSSRREGGAHASRPPAPLPDGPAIERLGLAPGEARAARGWCGPGSAAARRSPARCSSPWCTIRRRSGRSALPAAASSRRSRRRARASRPGSGRRAGRSPRRGARRRLQPPGQRRHRRRGPDGSATNGAASGASATSERLLAPPPTRPRCSGMPTPDCTRVWNPWAPISQATAELTGQVLRLGESRRELPRGRVERRLVARARRDESEGVGLADRPSSPPPEHPWA